MWLTRTDLGALAEAGLRTDFFKAYYDTLNNSIVNLIATEVVTDLPEQKYGWLGDVPSMREFGDERVIRHLKKYEYRISDRVYEATIGIDRTAFEDEQYNMIRTRVADLGAVAGRFVERQVVTALENGFTTVGPDGQYFFDTDHDESGTNQSNVTSASLSATSLQTAISTMMQYTSDSGDVLGITPTHLLVGPLLRWRAMELLNSSVVVASSTSQGYMTPYTNVLQGALTLLVSPYVTGYKWYVLDLSRPLKPVILQRRSNVPTEFVALTNPENNELAFMRDQVYFGVRMRFGVGYGLWQTAYGSNATS